MDKPILKGYREVPRPSGMPQYRVMGTDHYQRVINVCLKSPGQGSNGKGHFKEQALASGLMELVERYSCCKYILDNRNVDNLYSFKDLKSGNLFQLEDLYANLTDKSQRGILKEEEIETARIRWYDGYSLSGKKVRLPLNLILRFLEGTNGMAAGNSLEEALLHGICEVIERHCVSLIELSKLTTPRINSSTVNSPIAQKLIKRFQSLGHAVFIRDFSLGTGLPVIGVVRKINKTSCLMTAGAATTADEALIRALAENSQIESKRNYQKIRSAQHYFADRGTISMKDILNIDNKNMRLELENIAEILNKQNMKVFFVDATDKALNIPSVFVYISAAKTIFYHETITNRSILKLLISICFDTENYGDLEKYLKKAVKNNYLDQFEYSYFRGIIFKRHLNYRKAIRYLLKVAKSKVNEIPGSVKADQRVICLLNLGLCYQAINDKNAAMMYYLKAIDLSPDFSIENLKWHYDNIRSLSREKGLFNAARQLYQDILLLRRRSPGAGFERIKNTFYRYKKTKKNIVARIQMAEAYANVKQYDKAIVELKNIIRSDHAAGRIHNVHLLLGFYYEKTGQYEKAIRELKKAEKINSEEPRINFTLSKCYRFTGKIESSNKELDRGVLKLKKGRLSGIFINK